MSHGTLLYALSAGILLVTVIHFVVDRTWLPPTWRRYWLVQVALYAAALLAGAAMTVGFNIWIGIAVVLALVPAFWLRVVRTWLRRENATPRWSRD